MCKNEYRVSECIYSICSAIGWKPVICPYNQEECPNYKLSDKALAGDIGVDQKI